ncbi:hypothetical protein PORY_002204 [Pneumocystis oryctolagi]|uniref:Uncharacterized protein n=1 Tax=Pneumocystis oryctolagi TaxID=42067 RepID=A0ACB7C9V0_9ASCO|nr:hypothetical protein PORY_002204 [Pneumocystis oryctolagi]
MLKPSQPVFGVITTYASRIRTGNTSLIIPIQGQSGSRSTGRLSSRGGIVSYAEKDEDDWDQIVESGQETYAADADDNGDNKGYINGPPPDSIVKRKPAVKTRHMYRSDDQMKLKDVFTWNMNEELITPDLFAQIMCADLDIPASIFAPQISSAIRTQIEEYAPVAEISLPENNDLRVIVNLSLHLSRHLLTDKFEWDLTSSLTPEVFASQLLHMQSILLTDKFEWDLTSSLTPEVFASQVCADLGLGGEFYPAIAHAIHEHVLRLKKEACEGGLPFELDNDAAYGAEAGIRVEQETLGASWAPHIEVLSREEIEKRDGDRERQVRRTRREASRFGIGSFSNFGERRGGRDKRGRSQSPNNKGLSDQSIPTGVSGAQSLSDYERARWRCSYCHCLGTGTWAVRRGPSGNKTLCNPCGVAYAKTNELPLWRKVEKQGIVEKGIQPENLEDAEPTEEEVNVLRRVADKIPFSAYLVVAIEFCERFTYYGIANILQNFMQHKPTDVVPGVLGLKQSGATALNSFFTFWVYVTPVLGAIIADQYLGRYWTIFWFSCIYFVGQLVLIFASLPFSIKYNLSFGGLIIAMIIIGLGTGGIKANVSPLVAEQYRVKKRSVKTLRTNERVIVDYDTTIQRIFLIFYFSINLGSLVGTSTIFLEKYVGFWAAFLLPACVFVVGMLVLILGKSRYTYQAPQGSVVLNVVRAIYVAIKNGFNLEKAKPSKSNGKHKLYWDDAFIDELRITLVACKIFVYYPIYWVSYAQMASNLISQAGTMQLHGVPPELTQEVNPLTLILLIPVFDNLIYPTLRKYGILFRPIARITMGYAFTKAPASMKSFVMSLFLLTNTGGSLIQMMIAPLAKDPILVWLYTSISIVIFIAGCLFWFLFKKYNEVEDEMNTFQRDIRLKIETMDLRINITLNSDFSIFTKNGIFPINYIISFPKKLTNS